MIKNKSIYPCVIGLGYVGLPIFLKLSNKFETCGFDINKKRIKELKKKKDINLEHHKDKLILKNNSYFTNNEEKLSNSNFFIISVPTPVNKNNKPDLSLVKLATKTISKYIKLGDVIILESTVYPGVTEEVCGKILKEKKNLNLNEDFFLGYSPERINPGDKKHYLDKITKIVAYPNKKCLSKISKVYKNLGKKIVFTKKIKETETAKVVENIQRDLNIAFINEIFIFCKKSNLDFHEVLRLAQTKWNFLKFKPGLVGGHCLPVDPYYFAEVAKKKGQNVRITLSGRQTNNYMADFISSLIIKKIKQNKANKKFKYLIAGLTYKPNVPDVRNSLAIKIYNIVKKKVKNINGFDPFLKKNSFKKINLEQKFIKSKYNKIFILTEHDFFKKYKNEKNDKFIFAFKNL